MPDVLQSPRILIRLDFNLRYISYHCRCDVEGVIGILPLLASRDFQRKDFLDSVICSTHLETQDVSIEVGQELPRSATVLEGQVAAHGQL